MVSDAQTKRLSYKALQERWREISGVNLTANGYVTKAEENLLDWRWLDDVRRDYERGMGSELKGKFLAVHSSAALVANCFAPFRKRLPMPPFAGESDFTGLEFEAHCPSALHTTAPNLDLVAKGLGFVVAVESKCTEPVAPKTFSQKQPPFSEKYDHLRQHLEPGWLRAYEKLKRQPNYFGHLDATQLVKHYLGLRHTHSGCRCTLLYLYWEPANASQFESFMSPRSDLARFAEVVGDSQVRFAAMNYFDLWKDWEHRTAIRGLQEHVKKLRLHYEISI